MKAKADGREYLVVPEANAREAAVVEGISIYPSPACSTSSAC